MARRWRQPKAPNNVASLAPFPFKLTQIQARVDQGPCKIKSRSPLEVRCPDQSSLIWEISEIDYKPRACLAYRSSQLGPITLSFQLASPQSVQKVVGHVGFSDFNARLRSDAALQVSLRSGDQELLHQPFSDAQGWAAFDVPLPALSQDSPTFHLSLLLNASQAQSQRLRRPVIPCIELRFQSEKADTT